MKIIYFFSCKYYFEIMNFHKNIESCKLYEFNFLFFFMKMKNLLIDLGFSSEMGKKIDNFGENLLKIFQNLDLFQNTLLKKPLLCQNNIIPYKILHTFSSSCYYVDVKLICRSNVCQWKTIFYKIGIEISNNPKI